MEPRNIIVVSSNGNFVRSLGVDKVKQLPLACVAPTNIVSPSGSKKKLFLPNCYDYTEKGESDDEEVKPPRKKTCLTHLTDNEKSLRRKMKNRESAQTARDRKKFYLESLEQKIKVLEDEKLTLQQAKQFVDSKCAALEYENQVLRQEVGNLKSPEVRIKQETLPPRAGKWEEMCRQLVREKNEMAQRLKRLEDVLCWKNDMDEHSNGNEQLDCLVPIENEVEVISHEERSESAALLASLQQSRFLHALVILVSTLLLSTKFPTASDESITLLESALKQTQKQQHQSKAEVSSAKRSVNSRSNSLGEKILKPDWEPP